MKTNIFLLAIALTAPSLQVANAQTWFPLGATWVYTYGIVSGPESYEATITVTEQNTADGLVYSTIALGSGSDPGFELCQVFSLPVFVYQSNDSIFYATSDNPVYRLALVTNAIVNNAWHIAREVPLGPDSNLVVVQNLEMVDVNGANIQKWTLDVSPGSATNSFEITSPAEVLEYAGSHTSMLFPLGLLSACDATTNVQLRCYTDQSIQCYRAWGRGLHRERKVRICTCNRPPISQSSARCREFQLVAIRNARAYLHCARCAIAPKFTAQSKGRPRRYFSHRSGQICAKSRSGAVRFFHLFLSQRHQVLRPSQSRRFRGPLRSARSV